MGKMVNKTTKRMRCEAFPCKQLAAYTIGPEGRRFANYSYCEEDFMTIIKEGAELLGFSLVKNEVVEEKEETTQEEPKKEVVEEKVLEESGEPKTTKEPKKESKKQSKENSKK